MGQCKYCEYFILDGSFRCGHCGTYQKYGWFRNNFSAFGALATVIMAFFIGFQSCSIKKQTDIIARKFTLENRPHLYVMPKPLVTLLPSEEGEKTLLAGVFVSYSNLGNHYARDIEVIDYALYSDKQPSARYPVKEYWEQTYGGVQKVDSVPPKKEVGAFDCRAGMQTFKPDQKRYIQFSIRVKYKGLEKEEYKYGLDYMYIIDGVANGIPRPLILYSKQHLPEFNEELTEIKYLIDEYKAKVKK